MSSNGGLPHDWELAVEGLPLEDVEFLRDAYQAVAEAFRRRQIATGPEKTQDPEDLYFSATGRGGYKMDRSDFYRALDIMAESALPVESTGDGYRATSGYTPSSWEEILEAEAE